MRSRRGPTPSSTAPAGAAYHDGTLYNSNATASAPWASYTGTTTHDYGHNDWILSTDQWPLYRYNRARHFDTGAAAYPTGLRIALNYGDYTSQYMDWACAEIIFYNRELLQDEINQVGRAGRLASWAPPPAAR